MDILTVRDTEPVGDELTIDLADDGPLDSDAVRIPHDEITSGQITTTYHDTSRIVDLYRCAKADGGDILDPAVLHVEEVDTRIDTAHIRQAQVAYQDMALGVAHPQPDTIGTTDRVVLDGIRIL